MQRKKFELNRVGVRLVREPGAVLSSSPIDTPKAAVEALGHMMEALDREMVCAIYLDSKCQPLSFSVVSIGTLDASICNPREIFKAAILSNASGILLLHNHPSGIAFPSQDDVQLTQNLYKACNIMGLTLYDHIIVGSNQNFYSFAVRQGFGQGQEQ